MPGVYNQDDELCLRASYFAETVTLLPNAVYYFLRTTGDKHKSIMNSGKPKYGFDYITVSKSLNKFADEHINEKDIYKLFQRRIAVLINCGINAISKCSDADQKKYLDMFHKSELKRCYYRAGGRYLIEGILFSVFPNKMIKIFKRLQPHK